MDNVITKYIAIAENNHDKSNFIKIYLHYDLGGYNYYTGQQRPRGYYLTVLPVEKGGRMEGFTAFTGYTELITQCSRKSKKAESDAIAKYTAYAEMMIRAICDKYGYILEVDQCLQ